MRKMCAGVSEAHASLVIPIYGYEAHALATVFTIHATAVFLCENGALYKTLYIFVKNKTKKIRCFSSCSVFE